jgi:hypothetical protein
MNLIAISLAKRAERLNAAEQTRIDEINRACVERMRQRSAEIKRDCDALWAALRFGGKKQ